MLLAVNESALIVLWGEALGCAPVAQLSSSPQLHCSS